MKRERFLKILCR